MSRRERRAWRRSLAPKPKSLQVLRRRVTVRLSDGEYQHLKALARQKTGGNLSRLTRHYILEGMKKPWGNENV